MSQSKKTKGGRLDRYAGEWVALVRGKIVEHEPRLPDLMSALERKNLDEKASVLLVPRKDEGPYILLL